MTEFQNRCLERCRAFLRDDLGLPQVTFKEIIGKHETYYKYDFSNAGQKIELYVYYDEAGFMIDGHDWTICERPDYPHDERLIDSFIEKLKLKVPLPSSIVSG
jgi:hypothetical protein